MVHALKSVFAGRRRTIIALGATLTVVAGGASVRSAFAEHKGTSAVSTQISAQTNVRAYPSTDAAILTTLPAVRLQINCQARGPAVGRDIWWDQITLADGRTGWVSDNFVLGTDSVGHPDGDPSITKNCPQAGSPSAPVAIAAPAVSDRQYDLACNDRRPAADCASRHLPQQSNLALVCDPTNHDAKVAYFQCRIDDRPEVIGVQRLHCDLEGGVTVPATARRPFSCTPRP